MDVILHIGAHLCATTTFQDYLHQNRTRLAASGCAVWGPRRTRHGLFAGLMPDDRPLSGRDGAPRAAGRIRINLAACAEAGAQRLIVSDPGVMGAPRVNLRLGGLYCGLGERMARLGRAFDGYRLTVALNIRALDAYWAAVLSQAVTRGAGVPSAAALERLASAGRSWRDVIAEVAGAIPGADLVVLPFETFGGRPEAQLEAIAGLAAPRTHARGWLNATPRLPELRAWLPKPEAALLPPDDDRWRPFSEAQAATLREGYADDMMWIIGGAGGIARLAGDPDRKQAADPIPPHRNATRGICDDKEDRRLAGAG
ncbi:hypothetical protein E1832_20325 [Antarcticimicrobium luteum]|uniref:Uncharacterized protein n=2 Tax=Antarcticimicrobium luteum TaxID=2547397 RepID=A0A4R5UR59_9RHOB|nr:hypothetical protein E1832_20325 [Antarcticimicrobium luteum]